MKNRYFWGLVAGLLLIMGVSASVSAETTAVDRPGFTAADSEFYLEDQLYFFFRPGLVFTITDYEIPSDLHPVVTFTVTDPSGLPLDKDGVYTPGLMSFRFFISYIPVGEEQIVSYVLRSSGSPTSDRLGTYTTVELGTYTYRYDTELPADYAKDATTIISAVASRDLGDFDLARYDDYDVINFVPNGSTEPMPRDVVDNSACTRCHDPFPGHGNGRYQAVPICENCHNPQLYDEASGLSYSFNAMIHRVHSNNEPALEEHVDYPVLPGDEWYDCSVCHTGGIPTEDLPMVANPNPAKACNANGLSMTTLSWYDEGDVEIHLNTATGPLFAMAGGAGSQATGEWVMDGQDFVLVDSVSGEVIETTPVNNSVFGCATNAPGTYRGTPATQWDRWTSRPARAVCGGCHANIDFETGEGHIVQLTDDNCGNCHKPYTGNEFDRSVTGAHQIPYKSAQLPGLLVKIISITNTAPGRQPRVEFSIADKFGPIDPNSLQRLLFSINGPNEDFAFYAQEDSHNKVAQSGENWVYNFSAKIPKDATGSYTLGVEGRKPEALDPGPCEEAPCSINDQMQNFTMAFAVTDDEPVARRVIVDDATCENCHSNLSLHGENRHNATSYCQTCHMPFATDDVVRPAGAGPDESIHFKYMIHKIHRGAELDNGYVVYGYRGSVNDFSDIEFPGQLNACDTCHTSGGPSNPVTYNLPLPEGELPTYSPNTAINPFMQPITSACLSCHDSDDAAAHADANTSANLGESCNACHSEGKTYSVERVHAR